VRTLSIERRQLVCSRSAQTACHSPGIEAGAEPSPQAGGVSASDRRGDKSSPAILGSGRLIRQVVDFLYIHSQPSSKQRCQSQQAQTLSPRVFFIFWQTTNCTIQRNSWSLVSSKDKTSNLNRGLKTLSGGLQTTTEYQTTDPSTETWIGRCDPWGASSWKRASF